MCGFSCSLQTSSYFQQRVEPAECSFIFLYKYVSQSLPLSHDMAAKQKLDRCSIISSVKILEAISLILQLVTQTSSEVAHFGECDCISCDKASKISWDSVIREYVNIAISHCYAWQWSRTRVIKAGPLRKEEASISTRRPKHNATNSFCRRMSRLSTSLPVRESSSTWNYINSSSPSGISVSAYTASLFKGRGGGVIIICESCFCERYIVKLHT